jgi:hypothetical protein
MINRPSDYVYPSLFTPCRVLDTSNLAGTYFQPIANSGIGATLSNNGSLAALVIDSVTLNQGDAVCLSAQSAPAQNGLYEVLNPGSTSIAWVLIRRSDMQTGGQLRGGMHAPIGAGTANAGKFAVLVETLPNVFGTDAITFYINA